MDVPMDGIWSVGERRHLEANEGKGNKQEKLHKMKAESGPLGLARQRLSLTLTRTVLGESQE